MGTARLLVIIAYDVPDDRARANVAALLEDHMTRVQDSLFEGWMTRADAARLAKNAAILAGELASVRLYCMTRNDIESCKAWGFPPAPDSDGILVI